jgi:hypothetical protein
MVVTSILKLLINCLVPIHCLVVPKSPIRENRSINQTKHLFIYSNRLCDPSRAKCELAQIPEHPQMYTEELCAFLQTFAGIFQDSWPRLGIRMLKRFQVQCKSVYRSTISEQGPFVALYILDRLAVDYPLQYVSPVIGPSSFSLNTLLSIFFAIFTPKLFIHSSMVENCKIKI